MRLPAPEGDAVPLSTVVYSYTRFSSAAQADGDTVRRQIALRDAWLKRHPDAKLDTTLNLVDSGVSGFKGTNRTDEKNSLFRFLDAVERGRVPKGATLLVESVDRLTREHPQDAITFILDLIKKGVTIVTLSPTEIEFTEGMELGPMLMLMLECSRGHGESARKKVLCGQAWSELKRKARAEMRPLGKNLHPAWVAIDGGKHVLIPEKAAAVRAVYEFAAAGLSTPVIVRRLTEAGVPAIGRSGRWVRSYVQKILSDRSVLGEYQPCFGSRRQVKDGEAVEGYWPAAVTPELWGRARTGLSGRSTRPARQRPARLSHAFQGLLTDALDGCGMYSVTLKGRRYVVSQKGYDDPASGDTHRRPFPLDVLSGALISQMKELAAADLFNDPSAAQTAGLLAELATAERRLAVAVERFEADPESVTWAGKVDEYDRARRLLVKRLADARAEAADPLPARWSEAVAVMSAAEPARLRMALSSVVDDVRVLVVKRGQSRICAAQVFFNGGNSRSYVIRWTRSVSLPDFKRPELVEVLSFAAAGVADGIDLRRAEDVQLVEKAILDLGTFRTSI